MSGSWITPSRATKKYKNNIFLSQKPYPAQTKRLSCIKNGGGSGAVSRWAFYLSWFRRSELDACRRWADRSFRLLRLENSRSDLRTTGQITEQFRPAKSSWYCVAESAGTIS